MATLIDVVVKYVRREISEIVRCIYLTKKNSDPSQTVDTARIVSKTCHGQPPTMCSQYSRLHSTFRPNLFTFSGVIAKLINTAFLPHGVFPR